MAVSPSDAMDTPRRSDSFHRTSPRCSPPPVLIDEEEEQPQQPATVQQPLEDRVLELETKLATLSRMLQQQQRLSFRSLVRKREGGKCILFLLFPFLTMKKLSLFFLTLLSIE